MAPPYCGASVEMHLRDDMNNDSVRLRGRLRDHDATMRPRPPVIFSQVQESEEEDHIDTESDYESDEEIDDLLLEEVYRQIVVGDKVSILLELAKFKEVLKKRKIKNLTGDNDFILHIAAKVGQAQLIADILPQCNRDIVLLQTGSSRDLAFHSAAKAGQLDALKALTNWVVYDAWSASSCHIQRGGDGLQHFPDDSDILSQGNVEHSPGDPITRDILGQGNVEGHTPLHIALEKNQLEMAQYLVDQYCKACYQLNKMNVCPLYLAIKAGYWDLVKHIISLITKEDHEDASANALLKGKSVIHAVIAANNKEILEELLRNYKNLIYLEESGENPLSYAALMGNLEVVQYLFKEFPKLAFKRDKDGGFAIHKGAIGGHIEVIKELHITKRLLTLCGHNILHVAVNSGKLEVVSYLLQMQELEWMINMKDDLGQTPLHFAAKGLHPKVAYILTRDKRVKLELKNKFGLTALDIAETYNGPPLAKRLTWMALRYVNAPRSENTHTRAKPIISREQLTTDRNYRMNTNFANSSMEKHLDGYKNKFIDTHLIVATLVATVTFAAGFTLPGGYNQSEPDIGLAALGHKRALQAFIIFDMAAMYSSILAIITFIWGHVGDFKLFAVSVKIAVRALGFSLAMMSAAFMMGLFLVLTNQPWLAYLVLGLGSLSFVLVLLFLLPLYGPTSTGNPICRFLFLSSLLLLLQLWDITKCMGT